MSCYKPWIGLRETPRDSFVLLQLLLYETNRSLYFSPWKSRERTTIWTTQISLFSLFFVVTHSEFIPKSPRRTNHDLITDFRADLESECGILSLPSFHFSSVFLSSSPPSLCLLSSSLTPLLSSNLPPLSLPPGYTYPGIQLASCRPLSNFLLPVATAQSAKWWCKWSIAERGRRACLNLC